MNHDSFELDPVMRAISCIGKDYELRITLPVLELQGILDASKTEGEKILQTFMEFACDYVTGKTDAGSMSELDVLPRMGVCLMRKSLDKSRRINEALERAERRELDRLIDVFSSDEDNADDEG